MAEHKIPSPFATLRCPEPFPDCRPGACDCDGVYDRAVRNGHDPEAALDEFIRNALEEREVEDD